MLDASKRRVDPNVVHATVYSPPKPRRTIDPGGRKNVPQVNPIHAHRTQSNIRNAPIIDGEVKTEVDHLALQGVGEGTR